MARVGRLAGALLAQTDGRYFLVGNTKRPCDWLGAGFAAPGEINAIARPYVPLELVGPLAVSGPWLELALEGEPLLRRMTDAFIIERNGAVSDRLWRLVLQEDPEADGPPPDAVIDARWLGELPPHLWRMVRDTVLKCL
jgi:hypothetical protein